MRSALYSTNTLSWIFIVLAHWNNTPPINMSPTLTHYPDSKPTSLDSFSLMLNAYLRSSKYQFYSSWFDPTGARTHDLPHSTKLIEEQNQRKLNFVKEYYWSIYFSPKKLPFWLRCGRRNNYWWHTYMRQHIILGVQSKPDHWRIN